jgi:hypothetical protein
VPGGKSGAVLSSKNTLISPDCPGLSLIGKTPRAAQMVDGKKLPLNCREKAQKAQKQALLQVGGHKNNTIRRD